MSLSPPEYIRHMVDEMDFMLSEVAGRDLLDKLSKLLDQICEP